MTKRYLGNIITQNPTAPAGNLQNSAAKGVWSLEEQLAYQKAGLWPVPGNFVDITDVFSTYLYEGTGSAQTITNGIDLDGEGGLVWIKDRDSSGNHALFDTERGAGVLLQSNVTLGQYSGGTDLSSFNSNGFTLGSTSFIALNTSGTNYASWTFRKAPKFFDVVTYTGNGVNGREIAHDLGCDVGFMIIKRTDGASSWHCWHNSGTTTNGYIELELASSYSTYTGLWNDTSPTSTNFTVGTHPVVNGSGATYVAYLFAHNDGDGEFGPDADQDIIKCGSFTPDGSENATIDLGFEPQWFLVKSATGSGSWLLYDNMRGMTASGSADYYLLPNSSSAEGTGSYIAVTPTGIDWSGTGGGNTFIYIAIRRGPLAEPESATEVYQAGLVNGPNSNYNVTAGWPVDLAFYVGRSGTTSHHLLSRTGGGKTKIPATSARSSFNNTVGRMDSNTGIYGGTTQSYNTIHHMFRRSSKFFDAVPYSGNGTATSSVSRTINHGLGATPEFIIFVTDDGSYSGKTAYHSALSANNPITFDGNFKRYDSRTDFFADPTDTQLNVRDNLDASGTNYIAYCFATLAGISKVGSYSGNGTNKTIDCGFTSGARFVLIKRSDSGSNQGDENSHWYIIDSTRGIVSGNDPYSVINRTYFENTVTSVSYNSNPEDVLDPASTGFIVNQDTTTDLNKSGASYIFYAIA